VGDRGSVPFGAVTVAFGLVSIIALLFVHQGDSARWWASVSWVSGLFAFIGGLATVGTRWVGDPWWPSQRLGALGAGLAMTSGILAFVVLVVQSPHGY
jgi:hypothetical protein